MNSLNISGYNSGGGGGKLNKEKNTLENNGSSWEIALILFY